MIALLFALTSFGTAQPDAQNTSLVDSSVNGLRNRGREQLRENQIAEAVISFRLASERAPWDTAAREDLNAVREWLGTAASPQTFRDRLGPLEVWLIAILAGVSLAFGEIRYRLSGRKRWRGFTLAGIVVWFILFLLTLPRQVEPFAVVTTTQAVLRNGNSDLYEAVSEGALPFGSEVKILGQRGGWARVQTLNGKTGWIAENDLLLSEPLPPSFNADNH